MIELASKHKLYSFCLKNSSISWVSWFGVNHNIFSNIYRCVTCKLPWNDIFVCVYLDILVRISLCYQQLLNLYESPWYSIASYVAWYCNRYANVGNSFIYIVISIISLYVFKQLKTILCHIRPDLDKLNIFSILTAPLIFKRLASALLWSRWMIDDTVITASGKPSNKHRK